MLGGLAVLFGLAAFSEDIRAQQAQVHQPGWRDAAMPPLADRLRLDIAQTGDLCRPAERVYDFMR